MQILDKIRALAV